MYRSGELHREFGMRGGPYTGGRLVVTTTTLPGAVHQRLSSALIEEGPSAPIVVEAAPRASRSLALILAAGSVVGLYVLASWGFGSLGDPWAIQPWSVVSGYAVLLLVLAASLRSFVRSVRVEGLVPLPPGRYLLPYDFVEIEDGVVTIRPFGDARQVRVDEARGSVQILYADGSVAKVTGRAIASGPSVWARLLAAQHEVEEATHEGAPIAADPLRELRDASGWAIASEPAARAPQLQARGPSRNRPAHALRLALGLAFCVAAPPLTLLARNHLSDDAMFTTADCAAGYRLYLRSGGARHGVAVRQVLLPRAALDEAEQRNNVHALRVFLGEFPASRYDDEARARFHQACTSELLAESADSLRSFDQRNPDCELKGEIGERLRVANEERLERATRRGFSSLRRFIRSVPDNPYHDRAAAKLSELYQSERTKVQATVVRAELREALLGIEGRAQRDEIPGELYVPVTIATGDWPAQTVGVERSILAGFDAAIHDVLSGELVAIYHPSNVAPGDLARAHTLRIVIAPDGGAGDDDDLLVRYELARGDKTVAKWTRTLAHDPVPERFGAELARGAMTL